MYRGEANERCLEPIWILYVDGTSNLFGSRVGLILTSLERVVAEYALRFALQASNNQAEYEAHLAWLRIAKELRVKRLKTFMDS